MNATASHETAITLASRSAIRAHLLRQAGVAFDIDPADVDEDAIKIREAARGANPVETAMALAEAKAGLVAARRDGLVIGSDQILEAGGALFDKPQTMEEARARLLDLAGRRHRLINATALARGGAIVWRHSDVATLTMRDLTAAEIDAYLREAGEEILASVGAYQVEALGARLFTRIEGDFFVVLGMSLLPLLGALRREGGLAF